MLPRRSVKSHLVLGLLILVTVPGAVVTNWLVDLVEQIGALSLRELVIVEGAGISALISVVLYEMLITPWYP